MNLYSRKQRWKIVLLILALCIVGASLWYTNSIASRLRQEEIRKVEQWANDIRNNILQLNIANESYTNQRAALEALKQNEHRDVERWAGAMKEMSKDHIDYTFFFNISSENTHIPVILTDENNKVSTSKNLGFDRHALAAIMEEEHPDWDEDKIKEESRQWFQDSLENLVTIWSKNYDPIDMEIFGKVRNRVYYRESDLVQKFDDEILKLKQKSDSLLLGFRDQLKAGNPMVPMIFIDTADALIATNIPDDELRSAGGIETIRAEMQEENPPIPVEFDGKEVGFIYYNNSELLTQLETFPFVQLGIIALFLFISYLLFSTFRKAEQNQVWVGMAKETAHQLGTPISSLMAWTDMLPDYGVDRNISDEMRKDLDRLETISERFSKIGSGAKLEKGSVKEVIENITDYLKKRVSDKVVFNVQGKSADVPINGPLLEWVFENLVKNAVDAMGGEGSITFHIYDEATRITVDISDTGKGIPSSKFKTVFEPGYTTRKRGWGLGLTLVKRIVEEYHNGRIFVKESEPEKGTTFRMVLKK